MKIWLPICFAATAALLPLTAWSAPASKWSKPHLLTVVMVDNSFQPDNLTLQAGQPYELDLENRGKHLHEFTAAKFFHSATIRDEAALSNEGTDVVVEPGKTVRLFLIAPAKGNYDLTCADHDWDGMVGHITVD